MKIRFVLLNVVFVVVISFSALLMHDYLLSVQVLGSLTRLIFVAFMSIVLYLVLFTAFNHLTPLLKLYWGKLYLHGLWSYTYILVGSDPEFRSPKKYYFGVWRFDQDLFGTSLEGFGLTDEFEPRSNVRSVSNMIESSGCYSFFNIRTDSVDPERTAYSKTSISFDDSRHARIVGYPVEFSSETVILGGLLKGNIHKDRFRKHPSAKTESDVIEQLRNEQSVL